MSAEVRVIPCLSDNYAYLVLREGKVAVVDPSEAAPVLKALDSLGLRLDEIWCTHHHLDHVGGVPELVARFPGIVVRASSYDIEQSRVPGANVAHEDEARFDFGGSEVRVLSIPGHTLGAIAFLIEGALFSGDTLFLGGCGRVFEGTMPMMAASMRTLAALPDETRIYCGHEYTSSNLRFALSVEPSNQAVVEALEESDARARANAPSVPGTLAREKATNPFLRFELPQLREGLEPDASFARLREAKNSFRG